MTQFFNRPQLLLRRRQLRSAQTPTEVMMWQALRSQSVRGFKFRRQYSVGPYVLDFYCPAARLAIEIDGKVHQLDEAQAYDSYRQAYIECFGITFLRFPADDVESDIEKTVDRIIATAFALMNKAQ